MNSLGVALVLLGRLWGFDVIDEWASEKDRHVRAVLTSNFQIRRLFEDVMARSDGQLPAGIDLYAAGPPCQTFSTDGLGLGVADHRGVVLLRVVQTILNAKPTCFIIENVKGLVSQPQCRRRVVGGRLVAGSAGVGPTRSPGRGGHLRTKHRPLLRFLLDALQHAHGKLYHVRSQVLDTRVHGGLPQSRARLYLVGWRRDKEVSPFSWPSPVPMLKPEDILTDATESPWKVTKGMQRNLASAAMRLQARKRRAFKASNFAFANIGGSNGRGAQVSQEWSPCLTRTRCKCGGHYVLGKGRLMTVAEMERLQGLPSLVVPPEVSPRCYGGMLGNAFTVTVAGRVAVALLRAVGRLPAGDDAGEVLLNTLRQQWRK
ncbi:MAG: DNA (cytosine-5-)-methyltransferase [bacterium]|nr:DNA (cytosine-5-)-methyltransferase [bacterium]